MFVYIQPPGQLDLRSLLSSTGLGLRWGICLCWVAVCDSIWQEALSGSQIPVRSTWHYSIALSAGTLHQHCYGAHHYGAVVIWRYLTIQHRTLRCLTERAVSESSGVQPLSTRKQPTPKSHHLSVEWMPLH